MAVIRHPRPKYYTAARRLMRQDEFIRRSYGIDLSQSEATVEIHPVHRAAPLVQRFIPMRRVHQAAIPLTDTDVPVPLQAAVVGTRGQASVPAVCRNPQLQQSRAPYA